MCVTFIKQNINRKINHFLILNEENPILKNYRLCLSFTYLLLLTLLHSEFVATSL
jgi:hypothetical protein